MKKKFLLEFLYHSFKVGTLGLGSWNVVGWSTGQGHQGSVWTYLFFALVLHSWKEEVIRSGKGLE